MKLLSICFAWSIVSAAIVGIDFGHKFTKAMMVAPGIRFEIIPTDGGNRKDLSAIYVNPKVSAGVLQDAERAYGSQIGSLCLRSAESCAANLKSLLGKNVNDAWVDNYLLEHPEFHIVPSDERPNAISFKLGRKGSTFTFSAEELAAMSLAELKERVIKALTHHPQARPIAEDVAIAVPPYASQISRYAFIDALNLANYSSVLGLVDEGCAAALAYISDRKFTSEEYNNKTVYQIIYDLGAGSTTATLFSFTPFENKTILLDIESVGYDDSLGGDLLTYYVYDILFKRFIQHFKLDSAFEMPFKMRARLSESAEKAKTILSANADSKVSLESFWNDEDFKTIITREEFEDATTALIERINKPILDALKNSPTGPKSIEDIESVILNGGTTRTPFIQKQLTDLLGEGKVSKVLNADEACAYGTTIRAFQLKMITGTGSDIILKDRTLNDFEISVNGSKETQLVFPKGSSAGNTSLVNLGKVTDDRVIVGLHENGKQFGSYNVTRLASRVSDLNCSADNVFLYGKFALGEDKIFALDNLYIHCAPLQNQGKQEIELDEKNSTSINSTTKKLSRSKIKVGIPTLAFTSLRPYNFTEKRQFMSTLTHLKALEEDKIVFDHTKNILESACYSLRFYIDEHFDVLSGILDEAELDQMQKKANEMLEWVDYESDSSSVKEIENKLSTVKDIKHNLESKVRMLDSDLSVSALEDLLSDGNSLAQSVQDYLLEFGSQIKQVREKYETENLDFEVENQRIMKKIYGFKKKDLFDLEIHFLEFKKALKNLTDITNLSKSKFEKLTQQKKFDATEAVNKLTLEMTDDVQILQKQHEERITYLLERLEKLKARKKQKELKAKMREEKEKEKAEHSASAVTEALETSSGSETLESASLTSKIVEEDARESLGGSAEDQADSTNPTEEHDEL